MENINSPFFSNEGLTSVSANYICNLAKEMYQNLESELENICFYDTTVKLIGTTDETLLSKVNEPRMGIEETLYQIADAKSLIAWLRESIKKKDALFNEIKSYTFEDFCKDNNIELKFPTCKREITERQYWDSLSVKDRNRYYELETLASVIGQAIHPDGDFSKARKDLTDAIQKPIEVDKNGRDTLIYTKHPKYEVKTIDNQFFKLQTKHREVQAQLNGMKHLMEDAIKADIIKNNLEYKNALAEYKTKEQEYIVQYNEFVQKRKQEIQDLKIVIPNSLKDIYNKINSLGK